MLVPEKTQKKKMCVSPDAKPQRQPVEYRLRWVPGVGSLCWACTFHIFCVDFICVGHLTQTRFSVEYGLNIQVTPTNVQSIVKRIGKVLIFLVGMGL